MVQGGIEGWRHGVRGTLPQDGTKPALSADEWQPYAVKSCVVAASCAAAAFALCMLQTSAQEAAHLFLAHHCRWR